MEEPTKDILVALGRMHFWYGETRRCEVNRDEKSWFEARDNWKNARHEYQRLKRQNEYKSYHEEKRL